jgi:hypothetical protein
VTPEEARASWWKARTVVDLGDMTARWLEGRLPYLPAYFGDQPAEETEELISILAAINRAGFMTTQSQPGRRLGSKSGQRAFVTGFTAEENVQRIERALLPTELVMLATEPGLETFLRVPVTIDDGSAFTWVGWSESADDIDAQYGDDLSPAALIALRAAWCVELFDPKWGRNTLLWPSLLMALTSIGDD